MLSCRVALSFQAEEPDRYLPVFVCFKSRWFASLSVVFCHLKKCLAEIQSSRKDTHRRGAQEPFLAVGSSVTDEARRRKETCAKGRVTQLLQPSLELPPDTEPPLDQQVLYRKGHTRAHTHTHRHTHTDSTGRSLQIHTPSGWVECGCDWQTHTHLHRTQQMSWGLTVQPRTFSYVLCARSHTHTHTVSQLQFHSVTLTCLKGNHSNG